MGPKGLTDWPSVVIKLSASARSRFSLCRRGSEYLHHSPAEVVRRKSQQKREPNARGYNWATQFLGEVNTGTGAPGWVFPKWGSKIWWVLLDLGLWVTALTRTGSSCTCKVQTHPLVREGTPHHEICNFQSERNLVKGSRWEPNAKTDWPTDCRP
jgi:hypothetical protein